MPTCDLHDECPGCGWCPCWWDDPAGNHPPGTRIPHHAWHQGLPVPVDDPAAIAEFAQAPRPADVDDLADDDLYDPRYA